MKGWMHINKRSWSHIKKKFINDLGNDLKDQMKDDFMKLDSYSYTCSDKVESIVYDCSSKAVGSEEWAVAASDTGGDWVWDKEPPYNKIKDWFIKHHGVDKNNPRLHAMIKNYQNKILDEGIHSHYWVDNTLADFVRYNGLKGSGAI